MIGGILAPTAGSVRVGGQSVGDLEGSQLADYRQRQVGFVFQAFNLVPSLNARENVAIPLILAGVGRRAAIARADELLERVGLADAGPPTPGEAVGRPAAARAPWPAAWPPIRRCCSPTSPPPTSTTSTPRESSRLLRSLRADGRLIVVSTHDDRLAPVADRVVHLVPDFAASDDGPRRCWSSPRAR